MYLLTGSGASIGPASDTVNAPPIPRVPPPPVERPPLELASFVSPPLELPPFDRPPAACAVPLAPACPAAPLEASSLAPLPFLPPAPASSLRDPPPPSEPQPCDHSTAPIHINPTRSAARRIEAS
jgi:hypothetical protein